MNCFRRFVLTGTFLTLLLLISPVSFVSAESSIPIPSDTGMEQPETDPAGESPAVAPISEPEAAGEMAGSQDEAQVPDAESPTDEAAVAPEPSSYMKLTGRIRRAKSGFVFVRTPVGRLTLFSEKGLGQAKSGQMVTLWAQDTNVVVDIHKKGAATPISRFITAMPVFSTPDQKEVLLWTPEGGQALSTEGDSKLSSIEEGKPITVQLNSAGEVVALPQLNIDIEISDSTKKHNGNMMKLAGRVSRVKAGFAFIETPIGILTLSKKTGLRTAQSGQEITVWLNDHHLVIDVLQEGAPAHRYVTGKIVYASRDKREIRLWTPEGEKTVPLPSSRQKRRAFREGTPITVQFNGSGEIIDVRKVR